MATNLRKFATLAEYEAEVQAQTLECPNVSYILNPRQVKYLEVNPPLGIGICAYEDGHRTFYTPAQWQALETKPTVVGVFVKSPDTGFIIHPTASASKAITSNNTLVVPGVTTTARQTAALQDFAGKENTDAYLTALDNGDIADAPAFEWLRGLSGASAFSDGSSPFLWAAGQLELARVNGTDINNIITLLGGTTIEWGTSIHSSTQYSATHEWRWLPTGWNNFNKSGSLLCRACALL